MKWFFRLTRHIEETFPALLIGALTLVVSIDVFCRYFLNHPIKGFGELATLMFVWQVFLGASGALRRGLHVNVDIAIVRLPPRGRAALSLMVHVCMLMMMVIVGVMGWDYAFQAKTQRIQTLDLPYTLVLVAVPISSFLMCLHFVKSIYEAFLGVVSNAYKPEQQGFEGTGALIIEDRMKEGKES